MSKSLWTGRSDVRRAFLLVLLAAVLYYVGRILEPFFSALAWAAILATLFFPVYQWMLRHLRRREVASGVTCLLLTVAIVFPFLLLVFLLAKESVKAYSVAESVISSGMPAEIAAIHHSAVYQEIAKEFVKLGLPRPDIGAAAMRVVSEGSRFLVEQSTSLLSGFMNFLLELFVMLFGLYYLFLQGPQILDELRGLIPLRPEYEEEMLHKFRGVVQATFRGNLGVALIQGVLGSLGFLIFGVSTPLLLGAVMGLASLVPVVGSALVWVPLAVFYLLTGSALKGLLALLAFGGLAATVDNIVKPLLVRRGMEIGAFWIFISIVGGLGVFGFLGLVLGPFLFAILVVLIEIYKVEFRSPAPVKNVP